MVNFLLNETVNELNENKDIDDEAARHYALVQMCRVILNLNELVYGD